MTKERRTPDEGYPILSEIYAHIEQIYDLFEVNAMNPLGDVWGLILDSSEVENICDYLTKIKKIIGGELDDIKNGEILPYSRRLEMEEED